MAAATATAPRDFDHLREHSIGLPGVLLPVDHAHGARQPQSRTRSSSRSPTPAPRCRSSVRLALVACLLAANSIGQLAKEMPSAGGLYTYVARSLGPYVGLLRRVVLLALRAARRTVSLPRMRLGDARGDVDRGRLALDSGQWWVWVLATAAIVFLLTFRDIRHLDQRAGIILGIFEISVFAASRDLDAHLERRPPGPPGVQPHPRPPGSLREQLHRRLQGNGLRDSRLHRLRGVGAARRGSEATHAGYPTRGCRTPASGSGSSTSSLAYAWVYGGRLQSLHRSGRAARPIRGARSAKMFWGAGWVLVFAAIINSIIANSNAGFNAATRVFYCDGAQRASRRRRSRARIPRFKTPHVAILVNTFFAVGAVAAPRLEVGAAERLLHPRDRGDGLVILVYMLVMLGLDPLLPHRPTGCLQPVPDPPRLPGRGDRAVRVPALLPVPSRCRPTRSVYAVWFALGWVIARRHRHSGCRSCCRPGRRPCSTREGSTSDDDSDAARRADFGVLMASLPQHRIGRDDVIWAFGPDLEPVLEVEPGDVVTFETNDCFTGQIRT